MKYVSSLEFMSTFCFFLPAGFRDHPQLRGLAEQEAQLDLGVRQDLKAAVRPPDPVRRGPNPVLHVVGEHELPDAIHVRQDQDCIQRQHNPLFPVRVDVSVVGLAVHPP